MKRLQVRLSLRAFSSHLILYSSSVLAPCLPLVYISCEIKSEHNAFKPRRPKEDGGEVYNQLEKQLTLVKNRNACPSMRECTPTASRTSPQFSIN